MRERLTKSVVESFESGPKDYVVWDRDLKGFGLKITTKGKKVYFAYYRTVSGRQRKPAIAAHGKVTTEEARQIAKKWIALAVAGQDVSAERQEARAAPLFRELAEKYLKDYAEPNKKPSSVQSDRSNLAHHVLPLIGTKMVADIKRADIEHIKNSVREGLTAGRKKARHRGRSIVKGGPGVANRVVSLLSKIMACAVDWGMRADNPALRIKKYPEHRKDRFLDTDEIQKLVAALKYSSEQRLESADIVACFHLLLLTGLRLR